MRRGFTLIELLVVVAIGIILIVMSVTAFVSYAQQQALHASARQVSALMEEARGKTLASLNRLQYGLHFEVPSDTIILFSGEAYINGDPTNRTITLDRRVQISAVGDTTEGGVDLTFERLTGRIGSSGDIVLSLAADPLRTVSISYATSGLAILE